jgi:Branched-chain amino acid ATP-binding cassette transporter
VDRVHVFRPCFIDRGIDLRTIWLATFKLTLGPPGMRADLADRVHLLDYRRSIADGRSDQVFSDPKVIQSYLGTLCSTKLV